MTFPLVLVVCLFTPLVVGSLPRDCADVHRLNNTAISGVHTIYPADNDTAVQAYCDMDTDGGTWTVFQRRMDGSVGFTRLWEEYKRGFGNADGEYWLGLENLFYLTYKRSSELRVDMEDFSGNSTYAHYGNFYIDSEVHGYALHFDHFTDGGAGDSLSYHNGQRFSTLDRDQDSGPHSSKHCAREHLGGWWYNSCVDCNPNGVYLWGDYSGGPGGVGAIWQQWKHSMYSLKSISMKVRPQRRREEQDGQTDQ